MIGDIEGTGEAQCWQEWRGRGLREKASQSYPSHWQDAFPEPGRARADGASRGLDYERTLAYLIEEYAGALPTWMSPEQVRILPITDRTLDYSKEIQKKLEAVGVRVELDERSEKIGKKIRDAQLEKVPYMLVLGDKEAEAGQVAVRSRKTGETEVMTADEFVAKIVMEIATKAK